MARVVLAECGGNVWLVAGEAHLDALLFNTLPPDVTTELLAFDEMPPLLRLWRENGGGNDGASIPTLINPRIAARVRRALNGPTIRFAPWSAMLDADALAALDAAAEHLIATPALRATLVDHVAPDDRTGRADLSRLRLTLIRARLAELGVPMDRVEARTDPPGSDEDGERINLRLAEAQSLIV